jgi:CRP/FNR family transcriptional regulator, cyclic AMP receptor protein
MSARPERPPDPLLPGFLELAGDEAVLPAGSRLADEERPGRQCFVIIDGRAAVERGGTQVRSLGSGDFVGDVDASGGPQPPAGVTVRLETRARVLVIDSARLAALIEAEPATAAAWRSLINGTGRDGQHGIH